ncbi:MAG: helix-turn-helix domain-containing protein [Mesorhizobium sp.]|nr:MAG: helix-turn-helix domain-containing protein [Mesorhizobium sp.]
MEKLIEYLDAERGRRQALAAALRCSPSTISMWKRVPAERIGEVSRATGIPPEQLRPDIFGLPSKPGEAA